VLIRFLLVGLSNFAVSYVVYALAMTALAGSPVRALTSQALSYGAGIAWSFVWNRRFTFGSRGAAGEEFGRFLASQLAMLGVSSLTLWLLVDRAGLPPHATWLAVMTLITLANYLVSRHWVFRA
jgi:putative flippase GtrA